LGPALGWPQAQPKQPRLSTLGVPRAAQDYGLGARPRAHQAQPRRAMPKPGVCLCFKLLQLLELLQSINRGEGGGGEGREKIKKEKGASAGAGCQAYAYCAQARALSAACRCCAQAVAPCPMSSLWLLHFQQVTKNSSEGKKD
jgi:hypothetical protein